MQSRYTLHRLELSTVNFPVNLAPGEYYPSDKAVKILLTTFEIVVPGPTYMVEALQ